MKAIFLALTCVVFAYAQLTFTNEFVKTVEKTTTTNLIRMKNNGDFSKGGAHTISSIQFKINYESVKPKTAVATFKPDDDKLIGAVVGGAEGFLYFDVTGNEGTYQCRLNVKYYTAKGKLVKADPYLFTFTIAAKGKNGREAVGRVRPSEIEEHAGLNETGIFVTEAVAEVATEGGVQARQSGYSPACPEPVNSDYSCYWTGCNIGSAWPQTTANTISFKNMIGVSMTNIVYSFTNKSVATATAIQSAPTTISKLGTGTVQFTITSNGNCNTWFTFNVAYQRGNATVYTWSTVFNPVNTYPANSSWTCTY